MHIYMYCNKENLYRRFPHNLRYVTRELGILEDRSLTICINIEYGYNEPSAKLYELSES